MECLVAREALYNARSIGVTQLIYFELQDLLKVLVNYPQDFERFNMIKDRIKFNPTIQINERCNCC